MIRKETILYQADGLAMQGDYYVDEVAAGPRPGILVFPEAFGLGDHARARAESLASLGYAALACDLHGDARQIHDMPTVMAELGALMADNSRTRARAQGALDALTGQREVAINNIAAIGYCFGGTMALELGRSGAPIRGIAGFHTGLGTSSPQDAKNIVGKVLVMIGADDPAVPPEQRAAFEAEMRAADVDWRMYLYGKVVHSFTTPEADARGQPDFLRYDAGADARSWREMLDFLDETVGPPP